MTHDHHHQGHHFHRPAHPKREPPRGLEPALRALYIHLVEYLDERFDSLDKGQDMANQELIDLTREVAETKGAVASAIALLDGLAQQIRDNATDPAALRALANDLDAGQTDIANAIVRNTPTPPPVP